MAYNNNQASATLNDYMIGLNISKTEIEDTKGRGFLASIASGEKFVFFIYPLVHKQDGTKNYFDTRDSGAYERGVAWRYAEEHRLKYFCFGVNDQVDKFQDYIFSLECDEAIVEQISGTKNGVRNGRGNQIIIPNDYIPTKSFERIKNKLGVYIAVVHKDNLIDYIEKFDNRPYVQYSENDNIISPERFYRCDNKDFIFDCLNFMSTKNLFNEETLSILQNKQKCAIMFKHNSANGILYKINESLSENEQNQQRFGADSRSRYYEERYKIGENAYFVSSEWRPINENENPRELFVKWMFSLIAKLKYHTGYISDFSRNRILFGAPGTGKSFTLRTDCESLLGKENETDYERVTFHPDYSYANFVGTYKPIPYIDNEGKDAITYSYVPGPFMRIYVNALKNSQTDNVRPFLLIIEEINRANVAAVFGDIFQLLDRDDNGVSDYPIQATEDMKKFLADELGGQPSDYNKIRIPDNMFIWATMNSADQGVFPMDTAFKRRWDFTYIGINESETKIKGKSVLLGHGENQRNIEWNELRKAINDRLSSLKINEDKLLGAYFLSKKVVPEDGEINREIFVATFKNKVLMYLFDDAAKQKRSAIFADGVDTTKYSAICDAFDEKGVFVFCKEISDQFVKKDESA